MKESALKLALPLVAVGDGKELVSEVTDTNNLCEELRAPSAAISLPRLTSHSRQKASTSMVYFKPLLWNNTPRSIVARVQVVGTDIRPIPGSTLGRPGSAAERSQ